MLQVQGAPRATLERMSSYVAVIVLVAALLALTGTNAQARLARQALLANADPLIAAAGRTWRPLRWPAGKKARLARRLAEDAIRADPPRWGQYKRLCEELRAWNALESSVALGLSAALVACLQSL